jgi:predicted patatin/cPLA2 family phospholipase
MIHRSWKRIEILHIIDNLGIDVKQYSYLHKSECLKKFTEYIKSENLTEFEYLFKTKPIKHIPMNIRTMLTKKSKKIVLYCDTLDLELSKYENILQVKEDIDLIKNHQYIPCIRKAIELWNTIDEEFVPYIQQQIEYEISLEEEKKLKNKLNQLTIKRGEFLIDFS